ncbi:sirohydrochlorin cobaltochelatase [uncultured Duncaniella sp.]|uniref:sirohydrochlorin cobaltochelatase n=1 Tax=uncultured Duncaniella sp. TaxID=2768039 RepID=UPI002659B664|nr:sirohydrochlorin cobaltochelatase [uncultured Duncaniella sp.]
MKNLISLVVVLAGIISLNAQDLNVLPNNKVAILMVHFGTTFDDTRALTIDAINEKARQTFPGIRIEEAYTSRIIINRLEKRGIKKSTPQEALLRLAADGYTHVVVQGTNIIDGIEAEVLRKEAASVAPFFEEIRVGHPLLYSVEDCENVAAILASRYKDATDKRGAVVLIGHGTSTPANAIYSQMDYMFKANGNDAFHVATVEGYPTYETTLARLKADRYKTITLLPFMFVAGDHARNDIDGEWRENLEKAGFTVSTVLEGLGQISQIQDIFIEHIKDALTAPVLDALSQKKSYIKENI